MGWSWRLGTVCLGIKARLPPQLSPLFKDSNCWWSTPWWSVQVLTHWATTADRLGSALDAMAMQWWWRWRWWWWSAVPVRCDDDDDWERRSLTRRWWSAAPHSPARWSAAVHIYKFAKWMGRSVVRSWAQSSQDGTDSKDYCSIQEGFSALGRLRLMLNCLRVASRAAALPLK